MHISLAAETIGHLWGFPISNSFLMALIVSSIWIIIALLPKSKKGRFYAALEAIIEGMLSIIEGMVGRGKASRQILPIIATFFLMVITSNWLGIMPGIGSIGFYETANGESVHAAEEEISHDAPVVDEHATEEAVEPLPHGTEAAEHDAHAGPKFVPLFRPVNTDLNMTLAIALISVFMTQVISISNIRLKPYLSKFFNFSNPILFFVGLLEIISEIVKIFSFSFRLFGNLFAGEVLLTVISTLIPFVAPIPFLGIELFAGFVQALIFSMLTLVFMTGALQTHEAH